MPLPDWVSLSSTSIDPQALRSSHFMLLGSEILDLDLQGETIHLRSDRSGLIRYSAVKVIRFTALLTIM